MARPAFADGEYLRLQAILTDRPMLRGTEGMRMTTQVSTWARPLASMPLTHPRTTHGGFAAAIVSRVRAVLEADITERWRPAPTLAPAAVRFGRWQP